MRILFCMLFIAVGSPAAAKLEFCNQTSETVRVAIGYKGPADWTSEGWWSLPAGACKTVQAAALSGHYYYRAIGETLDWEQERYFFCTGDSPFTIEGDRNCEARGYRREAFNALPRDPDTASFTMNLTAGGRTDTAGDSGPGGEPITVNGLLSHCEVTDASVYCELHADGWRYVATADGVTPHEWLEYFLELPANTPMTWRGEMRDVGATSVDVALADYELEGHDPFAGIRFDMQGAWVSDDDSSYLLIVQGGVFEELYDGIPTDTSFMTLASGCPGQGGDGGTYAIVRSIQGGEPRCFLVDHVGGHELSLWSVDAMNMLNFTANGL